MLTAADILKEKGAESIVSVPPTTTLQAAIALMVAKRIGSIIVKDGDAFVGIWTERDLLRQVIAPDFNPATARIGDLMARHLHMAPATDPVYRLMDKFLGLRIRRLLIEKDGQVIGLLTAGDVMKACAREKDAELRSMNAMVGWEYYENWGWTPAPPPPRD